MKEKLTDHLIQYVEGFITDERRERFKHILAQRTNHFTVVTEDVYQHHNAAAVVRSCDVFGVQALHLVEEIYKNRIDTKIALGAQKWVTLEKHNKVGECMVKLRAKGYSIVATTPHHDAQYVSDFDITKPAAFFFGTEKEGLSDIVMEEADEYLKIPMVGFTESLNISVAAAIILEQLTTRLRKSDLNWQIPADQQRVIYFQWIKNTIKSIDQILERYEGENES
ncbi:RNA methyltransferase [Gangjinia marincola]|uniref:tRNA (guanosine(18)-2'-O)-methyltransferase n=1 Tax=Gangjinia marincola TaxID=578463 RepID=A0ABP3XUH2_9FLAO